MKLHKCYFCDYNTQQLTHFKNHITKQKKCSYLLRTCDITINNIDDYNKYVELHKSDPENDIWGIDYKNQPKVKYYDSDSDEEANIQYENFMDKNVYNKRFYCEYCNKSFSRKDNLKTHYNTCKLKKNKELEEKNKEILLLKEQLKNKIPTNIPNMSNISDSSIDIDNSIDNSVNNNNTTNNIINNHIYLNKYGAENKDLFLEVERMMMYFNQPFTAIPDIIKKLHFTPNKRPENTNIRIANISNGKIQVFNKDGEWKTRMKRELIKELIREYGTELGPIYEKYQEEGIIDGKIDKFEIFWNKLYKEDEAFMKDQEQQVECMLIDCCKKHKDYLNGLDEALLMEDKPD